MIKVTEATTPQRTILINPDLIAVVRTTVSSEEGNSLVTINQGGVHPICLYVQEDLDTILDLCLDSKLGGLFYDTQEQECEDDDDRWWKT